MPAANTTLVRDSDKGHAVQVEAARSSSASVTTQTMLTPGCPEVPWSQPQRDTTASGAASRPGLGDDETAMRGTRGPIPQSTS